MEVSWLPAGRLGRKIALAFVTFGMLVTIGFGLSMVSGLKSVERGILNSALYAELAHFRAQQNTEQSQGEFHSRTTAIYIAPIGSSENIPQYIRDLPNGLHDVRNDSRNFRVLIEEIEGIRYVIEFDDTNILMRERVFLQWVLISVFGVLLVSIGFGVWIAQRLSRPVNHLAQQILSLRHQPHGYLDLASYPNDEIGLLAQRFQQYHNELNALLVREKEFAADVSHELRTPVTTISLAADLLAAKPELSSKDADKIQRIQRATREMSELVETFLVLARISEDTEADYNACELKPVLEDVIAQQSVWLGDKPVAVKLQLNAKVTVPVPSRVLRVLIANLVRNAFRYTSEGEVTIVLEKNCITVTDTGVGIHESIQPRIFDRYVLGKSGDGSGLGLSIVKRICDRYGWHVSVESVASEGSCFRVEFHPEINSDSPS